ncbi:aquaporin NIP1-1 [Capsicum chacoense]
MAEILDISSTASEIKDENVDHILSCPCLASKELGDDSSHSSGYSKTISFTQKLVAEFLGTYLLMFAGFAAMVVNKNMGVLGIAALWGLDTMVMIYTVGHVSGAHLNPAVTIAFASCKRIAWKYVPAYTLAQVLGAIVATVTVRSMFKEDQAQFLGTIPVGSDLQSLGLEFLITFYLMFAAAGTAMDNPAVGELTGLVIGAVVTINSILAGPISGASMNPARSLGPAILSNCYKKQWIYILGPTAGAIAGIWFYNAMKSVKPFDEVTKFFPFHRRLAQNKIQTTNTSIPV